MTKTTMVVEYFVRTIKSRTSKDSGIILAGTAINLVAGGLFFILAPRLLGPVDYGIFATVVAISLLVVSIANFGIDTGILKFVSNDSRESEKYLSLAFKLYLFFGLTTSVLGLVFSNFIASLIGQTQIGPLLQISFSATILLLLTNFFVAALQARKQFAKASIVNLSSNVARLILLLTFSLLFSFNLTTATAIFFFVCIVSVVVGKIFVPVKIEQTDTKEALKFLKFNSFVAGSLIVSTIPFDNIILLKIAGPLETGIYAAPFKFLTFAHQFGGNFSKVVGIDFSHSENRKAFYLACKNALPIVALFSLGIGILLMLAPIINSALFGSQFSSSLAIMRILILGFAFFFLNIVPSAAILYYFGRSEIALAITIVKYVFYLLFLLILIPQLKAVGAAWSFTFAELISLLLMTAYVLSKLSLKNGN